MTFEIRTFVLMTFVQIFPHIFDQILKKRDQCEGRTHQFLTKANRIEKEERKLTESVKDKSKKREQGNRNRVARMAG